MLIKKTLEKYTKKYNTKKTIILFSFWFFVYWRGTFFEVKEAKILLENFQNKLIFLVVLTINQLIRKNMKTFEKIIIFLFVK